MKKLILFTLISLIFLSNIIIVQPVQAQTFIENVAQEFSGGFVGFVSRITGLPLDFFETDKVLYWVIVPFLAVWFAIYGVMSDIRLFRRKEWIHWALSFFMAFLLLPTGFFGRLIVLLYGLGGAVAALGVGIIFLIGAIAWFGFRLTGYSGRWAERQIKDVADKIDYLEAEKKKLSEQAESLSSSTKKGDIARLKSIETEITQIDATLEYLDAKRKAITQEQAKLFKEKED